MSPYQAALQGSKEIGFAVIAMTITLATVFTPLVFMTGRTGQLFTEFALTVSAAVLVSGFVALYAHADDVLEAAQAPCLAQRDLQPVRALLRGDEQRLPLHPARYAACALGRGRRVRSGDRRARHARLAAPAQGRVVSGRGSRDVHDVRDRPGRLHHAVHRPLHVRGRGDRQDGAGDLDHLRGGRTRPGAAQPGQPRHRLLRAQAVGGAHAQPDADHQGADAQALRRPARRALVHQGSALAGRQLPRQEDQLRPVRQQLRGAAGQARPRSCPSWPSTRALPAWTPTSS